MRITSKQLDALVQEIGNLLGKAVTKEQAVILGHDRYMELEYAAVYGGYRLNNVAVQGGGHSGALGGSSTEARKTGKEMEAYLTGVIRGINAANNI